MWREMRLPLMLHRLAIINLWPGERKVALYSATALLKESETVCICIYIMCLASSCRCYFLWINLLNICDCHALWIRPMVCCRLFQLMTSQMVAGFQPPTAIQPWYAIMPLTIENCTHTHTHTHTHTRTHTHKYTCVCESKGQKGN